MTEKSKISLVAWVTEGEKAAVNAAARHVAHALSQAADRPWDCDADFVPDVNALKAATSATILLASLLPELENAAEPWPQTAQRLRVTYTALGERGAPVFISTILRHVAPELPREHAAALRLRIRRLNLLAAEISRDLGVFVIDLDRLVADVGARRLGTDHRLGGEAASEMAAHFIALTLVTNGLDPAVPVEIQDAARDLLLGGRPAVAGADRANGDLTLKKDLLSLGQGRHKQTVATVAHTVEDNYAGWLVGQVLRGNIGPGEAVQRLVRAVRRRGVRGSAAMLASGLSRQISRKK